MINTKLLLAVLVLVLVGWANPVVGQQLGEMSGHVYDADGMPVEGVGIVAEHVTTGERHSAATGPQGQYRIVALPPGIYTVTAQSATFVEMIREGVRVQANDVARVNFDRRSGFTGAAPNLERLSLAVNVGYSSITGADADLVKPGFSLEGALRFNVGFVQLGAGMRSSTHRFRQVDHTYNTLVPFLELRKHIHVGSARWYPFVVGRVGYGFESMVESGAILRANGATLGGTVGIRYQANSAVGIEFGGTYDFLNFGDFEADAEVRWRGCIDQEAGVNMNPLIRTTELCSPTTRSPQLGDREFITYEGTARSVREFRLYLGATIILTQVTP